LPTAQLSKNVFASENAANHQKAPPL